MATNKQKIIAVLFIFLSLVYISGCAEFNLFEAPSEVLKHPLGTDPIKVGMSKEETISLWGKPDQINKLESTDEWQTPKEEWVYKGRYSKIPLDRSYFFKTKYLIFDGNNLVSFGDKSKSAEMQSVKQEKNER